MHLKKLKEILIDVAKNKAKIYYEEVMDLCNLNRHFSKDRKILGLILGEINRENHNNDKKIPMLTAVVTLKTTEMPNESFFELAEILGKKRRDQSNKEFYKEELKRVYEYWKNYLSILCGMKKTEKISKNLNYGMFQKRKREMQKKLLLKNLKNL